MRLTIVDGISELDPADWARLDAGRSPFVEYGFLHALERSGSVGPGTGWQPLFAVAHEDGDDGDDGEPGRLLGAVPAYVKGHSYGEYIFDWGWADAARRAGINYYPKLVVAVPFTPATGRRILLAQDLPADQRAAVAEALAGALMQAAEQLRLSSVHWLFVTEDERDLLARAGYLPRTTMQYHWRNIGDWADWDGFLGSMRGKRRREIRRERKLVREAGFDVQVVPGPELEDEDWSAIDRFYRDTAARKWGEPYLEPSFWLHLRSGFADRVRLTVARRDGELIAGALNFHRPGSDAMYGRYWGCDAKHRQLHFETCYYAAIDHCLQQGFTLYEAGAQGEHKVPRGFLPSPIHSAHWFVHPGLHGAVAEFLSGETVHTGRVIEALRERSPFKPEVLDAALAGGLISGS